MTGYWKVDHEDYWSIVWGGVIYQTPQDIKERWQQLFGAEDIEISSCSKEDTENYEAIGLRVLDLVERGVDIEWQMFY